MEHTQKKKNPLKIKSFEKKLHLGFLEFLLGAVEPANPVTPALDDAVLELIINKTKQNKTKKTAFFFPTLFLSNQKNKTNPPTLRVNLIQNQSLGISERERESKRVLANLVVVVCCCCCCFELGICCFVL